MSPNDSPRSRRLIASRFWSGVSLGGRVYTVKGVRPGLEAVPPEKLKPTDNEPGTPHHDVERFEGYSFLVGSRTTCSIRTCPRLVPFVLMGSFIAALAKN